MALHLVALRRQVDRDAWGAYVAADLLSHWYGGLRAVTPRLGARLGQMDGAALVVEARLAGALGVAVGRLAAHLQRAAADGVRR